MLSTVSKTKRPPGSSGRFAVVASIKMSKHDDLGTDIYAVVEIGDVVINEAKATRGDGVADCFRRIGAVNAVNRVAEIHGSRPEWIARASGHKTR